MPNIDHLLSNIGRTGASPGDASGNSRRDGVDRFTPASSNAKQQVGHQSQLTVMVFLFFFFSPFLKSNLSFLIDLSSLPVTVEPLTVHGVVTFVRMEIGESACKPLFCFFFPLNSQFPCNSHHKVKDKRCCICGCPDGRKHGLDDSPRGSCSRARSSVSKQQVHTLNC